MGLVNMSQSHIQRYADFISRPTSSPLLEKSLSDSDIDALIAKGEDVGLDRNSEYLWMVCDCDI